MSKIRFVLVLCILAWFNAEAQEKPDLSQAQVKARQFVCPDDPSTTCILLNVSGPPEKWYVVHGDGYQKEDTIWEVDQAKAAKATMATPYTEYMTVVWKAPKVQGKNDV